MLLKTSQGSSSDSGGIFGFGIILGLGTCVHYAPQAKILKWGKVPKKYTVKMSQECEEGYFKVFKVSGNK